MAFETWAAFAAASIALLLIPGPTVVLVLSYALSQGRRVAMATAAGVALGDLVAMTASLAGVGALVLASATLFVALKWVGALYLIYLGVKLFRSAGAAELTMSSTAAETSARAVFWHATLVTALNPKSIVFFIAFVPQFIVADMPLVPQFAVLITTFVALAAANALAYALLADRLRARIGRPGVLSGLTRLGGGALVSMGVATAVVQRA